MRRLLTIARLLLLALFAGTGVAGLGNAVNEWPRATTALQHAVNEWPRATTALQHAVSAGELAYGVAGLVAVFGLMRHRRWTPVAAGVWALAVTVTGSLAGPAYGGPAVTVSSALLAAAVLVLIGAIVVWAAHRFTRPPATRIAPRGDP